MSERERWIVYPLLFLALGAALRDKLVDRTTTKSIVCQELTVVDEQPIGNQPVRVLAQIGRSGPTSSGRPSSGYLVVNGELEVVDEDPLSQRPARVLAKIGRTEPTTSGAQPSGFLVINGVNGVVNAFNYAYRGVLVAPVFHVVLPGVPLPVPQPGQIPHGVQVPEAKPPEGNAAEQPPPASDPAASENKPPQNPPANDGA